MCMRKIEKASEHPSDLDYVELFGRTFQIVLPTTEEKSLNQEVPAIVIDSVSEPSWRPIPIIVEDKIEITELSDENESPTDKLEFNENYMKVRVNTVVKFHFINPILHGGLLVDTSNGVMDSFG